MRVLVTPRRILHSSSDVGSFLAWGAVLAAVSRHRFVVCVICQRGGFARVEELLKGGTFNATGGEVIAATRFYPYFVDFEQGKVVRRLKNGISRWTVTTPHRTVEIRRSPAYDFPIPARMYPTRT